MPATLVPAQVHAGNVVGYSTVTGIDPTVETTVFSAPIPPGQLDTVGAVFTMDHWGIVTAAADPSAFTITFRLKFGSSTVATATVTLSGTVTSALINLTGNVGVVTATTAEAHMIVMDTLGLVSGASGNTGVVTIPDVASGSITVTLTAQWSADPAAATGVYTARLTTYGFASS